MRWQAWRGGGSRGAEASREETPTTPGSEYQLTFAYASNYAHHDEVNPALAFVLVTDVASLTQLATAFVISHGSSAASDLDWVVHQLSFPAIDTLPLDWAEQRALLGFES